MKNLELLFDLKNLRSEFIEEYSKIPPFKLIHVGFRDKKESIDSYTKRYFNDFDANFFKEEIDCDEFIYKFNHKYSVENLYEKSLFCYINYYINRILSVHPKLEIDSENAEKKNFVSLREINPMMFNHDQSMKLNENPEKDINCNTNIIDCYSLSIQDSIELIKLKNIFHLFISVEKKVYNDTRKDFLELFENFILINFRKCGNLRITSILILIYSLIIVTLSKIFSDDISYNNLIQNIKKVIELEEISEFEMMRKKIANNSYDN